MKRMVCLLLLALTLAAGCGQQGLNTTPLTEEEKQKIKEDDRQVQQGESNQGKGKPKAPKGRNGPSWEP
jgi:hypothetical protein